MRLLRVDRWRARVRLRSARLALGALAVLVGAGLAPGQVIPVSQHVLAQPQSPDDIERYLELAERLLGGSSRPTIRLLPGSVADSIPVSLPTPPGGRLLGSMRQTPTLGGQSTAVWFEASGTPEAAGSHFASILMEQGWNPRSLGGSPGGFGPFGTRGGFQETAPPPSPRIVSFCREPNGAFFTITVTPQATGPHTVEVKFQARPESGGGVAFGACPDFSGAPRPPLPGEIGASIAAGPGRVPALVMPPGATLERGAGSTRNLGSGFGSQAAITTTLGLQELAAAFGAQLAELGWTPIGSDGNAALTWSQWAIPEQSERQGTLILQTAPGSSIVTAAIRVDSAESTTGLQRTPSLPRPVDSHPRPNVDPALTQAFVQRLLLDSARTRGTSDPSVALVVGRLSPELAAQLPPLPDYRLLGSMVATSATQPAREEAVFIAPDRSSAVLRHLLLAFTAAGWETSPTARHGSPPGPVAADAMLSLTVCRDAGSGPLQIVVEPEDSTSALVRVITSRDASGLVGCWPAQAEESAFFERFAAPNISIPPVFFPVDTTFEAGTTSIGEAERRTEGTLLDERSTAAIVAGVGAQLAAAGWAQIDGAEYPRLAWSTWNVTPDGLWQGQLLVFDLPGGRRSLMFGVEWAGPRPDRPNR